MEIDSPVLIILSSTGIIFITGGFVLYRWPPKKINMLYGYRTKTSMQKQQIWDFAQPLSGKIMILTGIFMILLGIVTSFFVRAPMSSMVLGILFLILITIFIFIVTEKLIKQKFG